VGDQPTRSVCASRASEVIMTNRRPHAQHHVYLPARDDSPGAFPLLTKPGSAEMITVRPSSRAAVCRPAAAGARGGQPGGDGGPPDHGKCGVVWCGTRGRPSEDRRSW